MAKVSKKVSRFFEKYVLTKPFTDAGSRDKMAKMTKMSILFSKKNYFMFKLFKRGIYFFLKIVSHSSHFDHFPSQTCMNTAFH